jgi:GH15 family glucan-1,4-alpha-glucosidase
MVAAGSGGDPAMVGRVRRDLRRMSDKIGNLELAVIGNCQVAALVDHLGRMVWACLPRPDGDPILCALLSEKLGESPDGVFSVELQDQTSCTQSYLRNTAILETRLYDSAGGGIKITDYAPRFRLRGRMHRPMSLVRIVEPLGGRPIVRLRFRPCSNYGAQRPQRVAGSHHLSFIAEELRYRLTTTASLSALQEEGPVIVDEPIAFILSPDETIEESPTALASSWLNQTREYWQEWIRGLAVPFDWQEAVIRAAITLKLCTFEDTGAVLAALTTSIPEIAGSERNWDYRFCWLRDSFFVVQALNRLGATRTMEAFLRYLDQTVARSRARDLQPLYGITGESVLEERIAPALQGFRGMGPVRIGNLAYQQLQYDVYGAVILAARQLFFDQRLTSMAGEAQFARLEPLGEQAYACFEKPDAGPWEFRGRERVHTFSGVMCWAGVERLARIARHLGLNDRAQVWSSRAARMRDRIIEKSWNARRGAFVAAYDCDDLDATALLLPELGLVEANDPRFLSTLAAVERELVSGDLVHRYRHADDFGVPVNTFTMCSFWYVNALAAVGRLGEARVCFERLLARRNAVGLFSEDIDPVSGEQWGNFPQTYSMVGIITSAVRLSRPWEEIL